MKSPKNLLTTVYCTEALGGGIVRVLEQAIKAQTEDGIKTELLYLNRKNTPRIEEIRRLFPYTTITHLGESNLRGLFRLGLSIFLLLLRKENLILHFHSSWAGFVGRLAAAIFRKSRTFYSPHGFAFLRTDISKYKRKMFWLIELILTRISPTVLLAYGGGEFEISNKLGNKVELINHYLSPKVYPDLQNDKMPSNRLAISTLGRIANAKNPTRFIELSRIFNAYADFIWIGEGEREKWDFEQSNVIITGWQEDEGVSHYLSKSDIFVLLSDWEGLPFSVFDAIAHSLPVVTWSFPGANDLLINGTTGYVCSTMEELEAIIRSLIENKELRNKLGATGNSTFSQVHSYETFRNNLRGIYLNHE